MTHDQEKHQFIEKDPETTEMMKLVNKDIGTFSINMFPVHKDVKEMQT